MSKPVVLFYHQLCRQPRREHHFLRNAVTPDQFRASMQLLKRDYHPLSMPEFYELWKQGGPWPRRGVVVTFDDGFKNNVIAARILNELGMPGTFFVLSDVVDTDFVPWYMRYAHILSTRSKSTYDGPLGKVNFDDVVSRRRWLHSAKEQLLSMPPAERDEMLERLSRDLGARPYARDDDDYRYMSSGDLRELCTLGMTVGSHSATHDNLARASAAELQHEVVGSRDRLAGLIDRPVEFMSYPDGRYDERVIELASRTYKMAFAASPQLRSDNAWRHPRRHAGPDISGIVSPWYPLRRRCVGAIKWCLGER